MRKQSFAYVVTSPVRFRDPWGLDTADVNFAFKSNVIGQNVGFTGFNIQLETKASVQKASYPTTSGKTTEGVSKTNKFFSKENISESLHAVLDAAGCVPAFGVVPDALNGIFYLAEGNKLAAGMSFLAALPYGDVIKGAKYGSKLGKEIVENGIEYAVKKGTKETGEELIETVAAKVSKGGKTSDIPNASKRQTPDQSALHKLAKEAEKNAKNGNPISYDEAKILDEWAKEYNVPQHHPAEVGSGQHFPGGNYMDHTHIYNIHVPYKY